MVEAIYNKMVREIKDLMSSLPTAREKAAFLVEYQRNLSHRITQMEKNKAKLGIEGEDFDYDEDSEIGKSLKEKMQFCHWLLEEYIHDEIAALQGTPVNVENRSVPVLAQTAITPLSEPVVRQKMVWKGSRAELAQLIYVISNSTLVESIGSAADRIKAVVELFVDPHGKAFPLEMFAPPKREVPQPVAPRKPHHKHRHERVFPPSAPPQRPSQPFVRPENRPVQPAAQNFSPRPPQQVPPVQRLENQRPLQGERQPESNESAQFFRDREREKRFSKHHHPGSKHPKGKQRDHDRRRPRFGGPKTDTRSGSTAFTSPAGASIPREQSAPQIRTPNPTVTPSPVAVPVAKTTPPPVMAQPTPMPQKVQMEGQVRDKGQAKSRRQNPPSGGASKSKKAEVRTQAPKQRNAKPKTKPSPKQEDNKRDPVRIAKKMNQPGKPSPAKKDQSKAAPKTRATKKGNAKRTR